MELLWHTIFILLYFVKSHLCKVVSERNDEKPVRVTYSAFAVVSYQKHVSHIVCGAFMSGTMRNAEVLHTREGTRYLLCHACVQPQLYLIKNHVWLCN